jgi:fatty acid desaturase
VTALDADVNGVLVEAHQLVRDLMTPSLLRYWLDLVGSALVGWSAVLALVVGDLGAGARAAVYVLAVLALYRASIFLHEFVHFQQRRSFTACRRFWNGVIGVPLLIPFFTYEAHSDHHSKRTYASSQDAEYLAFARLPRRRVAEVLGGSLALPFAGVVRFGLLTPLAWCSSRLRKWVWTQASTLKLDLDYRGRPPLGTRQERSWQAQEGLCFLLVLGSSFGVLAGWLPSALPLVWFLVLAGILFVNTVRLLGAHRYLLADEDGASVEQQMLDSYNYTGAAFLGELWGPVGLRHHALHHLLPGLPYHALPEAHRRLMAGLPAGSAYRSVATRSLLRVVWALCVRRAPVAGPRGDAVVSA